MLRPWIDVGSVGTIALRKLERYFGAKELGRLSRPGNFYDFTRYRPIMRTVEGNRVLNIPNTIINYAVREEPPDLLFFHLLEPQSFGEDYTDAILDIVDKLGVKQYVRIGGMYDAVPHTRPLIVSGTLDGEPLTGVEGVIPRRRSPYQGPTSIMNLVTDRIGDMDIESMMLMVRLPQYVQLEEDHTGAARLLSVLCSLYDFPSELTVSRRGKRQYERVSHQMENDPVVKALVAQLEKDYDDNVESTLEERPEPSPLPPSVEEFLRDLGKDGDEEEQSS
jgi:hypothetical protein